MTTLPHYLTSDGCITLLAKLIQWEKVIVNQGKEKFGAGQVAKKDLSKRTNLWPLRKINLPNQHRKELGFGL
jgi:hypothetical protein